MNDDICSHFLTHAAQNLLFFNIFAHLITVVPLLKINYSFLCDMGTKRQIFSLNFITLMQVQIESFLPVMA
jgi:hypothetical protein